MKENVVLDKSFEFAVKTVGVYKYLTKEKKEYILSKQLLRSGTSIGANINEATAAQSKKDFISKMAIASKEYRETLYWIRLLHDTDYLDDKKYKQDCEELVRSLTAIVKSAQKNLKNG